MPTYSSKRTSHYVGKQIQPIHALENSSAAPKINCLSELLWIRLETLVFICKCATNKTKEEPEKVLSLHESSIPIADSRPVLCPQDFFQTYTEEPQGTEMPFPRARYYQSHKEA